MSDLNELERIEHQAAAVDQELDEAQKPPEDDITGTVRVLPPLRDEIADLLDWLAKAGSFMLPTMPQRFTHEANLEIADAMIKLADRYGYNLRDNLLSTDGVVFNWIGLFYALSMPITGLMSDYRAMKKQAADDQAAFEHERPAQQGADGVQNSVVTGA